MNSASDATVQTQARKSTLIEFPGLNRTAVPEWRKELSERVRHVQERRAREATELSGQTPDAESVTPQLELLPSAELPTMNPLVAAALKRIERAHQPNVEDGAPRPTVATAVAYAPSREENEPEVLLSVLTPQLEIEPEVEEIFQEVEEPPHVEKTHNLVVVSVVEEPVLEIKKPEPAPIPKRLIVDDPNDPALNYLDSISRNIRVDEIDPQRPTAFRRLVCALCDLIICGLLCAPIAFAIRMTGTNLQELRAIEVLGGSLIAVVFIYSTLTTALTGRTLAMRLLSLRVIDKKTGLIPTGGQSIGRSVLYIMSLLLAGIGILFAVVSREGYTVHDRFTRTEVILT
jgi:uncharacterized RDD family membrane protein YckC